MSISSFKLVKLASVISNSSFITYLTSSVKLVSVFGFNSAFTILASSSVFLRTISSIIFYVRYSDTLLPPIMILSSIEAVESPNGVTFVPAKLTSSIASLVNY